MAQLTALPAELRELGGKSARLRLRQEGKIPAVMFGRATENTPIALDAKMFEQFLKRHGPSGIVELQIGADRGAAVIKEVQRHPISRRVVHVDFFAVSMTEKLRTTVPLHFVGEAPAVRQFNGTLLTVVSAVEVEALPSDLPPGIEVDVSTLETLDDAIVVGDLAVGSDLTVLTPADEVVAKVALPKIEVEEAAEEAEEAAEAEAAAEQPAEAVAEEETAES
jgi:large subunit ribosomal protein L25